MSFLFSNPQSQAAGQMYSNSANAYGNTQKTVNPFLTTQMQQGFSPTTYGAAMNRTSQSGTQNINNLLKSFWAATPNIAGQTGDALNSSLEADASTSATLAGENQQYEDSAAQQIASNDSADGQGYAGLGQDYQQAAASEGNPFSSLLSIGSMFVPGGQFASLIPGIMNMFGGGGGSGVGAPITDQQAFGSDLTGGQGPLPGSMFNGVDGM